jgi:hypothetical protein
MSDQFDRNAAQTFHTFWGDLHNHNMAGTGFGSMERTVDIARSNLDFFAFTGNSQWHDIGEYVDGVQAHWHAGFARHRDLWPENLKRIEEANEPGRFAALAGYEWHSSAYGDYNIIFPDGRAELGCHADIDELAAWARAHDALIIPHHLGYPTGARGANWDTFPSDVSPVVEIFSEHGACERDSGPFPYTRHGLGARMSGNSYQGALGRGLIVGATAGTDTHVGVPGAYAQGLTAVLAERLDRESLFSALWARRTYAVTGDRIELDFRLDGEVMGSVLGPRLVRRLTVDVSALDVVRDVEILRNNEIVYRYQPTSGSPVEQTGPLQVRVEFGWGPWADLAMPRTCDWDVTLVVERGELISVCPCFCGEPFDESRRSKIASRDHRHCRWISYTSRAGSFEDRPNGVVAAISATAGTRLRLELTRPVRRSIEVTLDELAATQRSLQVGGFQSEILYVHRPIRPSQYRATVEFEDVRPPSRRRDFYYARVTQDNGQMAWSSPIWVGGDR